MSVIASNSMIVDFIQHNPRTSTWPQAAAQAVDLSMASEAAQIKDIIMVLGPSMGHEHQHGLWGNTGHGPWQKQGPWASAWLQAATQTTDVNIASAGAQKQTCTQPPVKALKKRCPGCSRDHMP